MAPLARLERATRCLEVGPETRTAQHGTPKDQVRRHLAIRLVSPCRANFHVVMARKWHERFFSADPLPSKGAGQRQSGGCADRWSSRCRKGPASTRGRRDNCPRAGVVGRARGRGGPVIRGRAAVIIERVHQRTKAHSTARTERQFCSATARRRRSSSSRRARFPSVPRWLARNQASRRTVGRR